MERSNKCNPVFMYVGRKPHPFGNEWHTICCDLTSILWIAHIVEGKDRPTQIVPEKWEELGKTVGLMLLMCEPIFSTGKCVFFNSGFCVSNGITALLEFGVYAAALVKKCKYWPKGVPGDAIDQYFSDKDVTYVYILESITEDDPEGKAFNIFCFKESEYVVNIMATWMTFEELGGADTRREYKGRDGQSLVRQIKLRQTSGLHFLYHHQVDYHNNRKNYPISIESTWATKFWPNRNFAWYLAVTEVNMALADGHFRKGRKMIPTLQFRRKIAH